MTKSIDDPERLICYYYDIGDVAVGDAVGSFIAFDYKDRLQLVRVDHLDEDSTENYLDVSSLSDVTSDFNVMDGVTVSPGEVMALYMV